MSIPILAALTAQDAIAVSIPIGCASGISMFLLCVIIRGAWKRDEARRLKSEDYVIGYKDALREIEEKANDLDAMLCVKERK
jgi:hypothetical protein